MPSATIVSLFVVAFANRREPIADGFVVTGNPMPREVRSIVGPVGLSSRCGSCPEQIVSKPSPARRYNMVQTVLSEGYEHLSY